MESRKIIRILGVGIIGISLNNCTPEEIILHGEISGVVTDAETSQPLDAATVVLNPLSETTSTGMMGNTCLKALLRGITRYRLQKRIMLKIQKLLL